MALIWLLRGEAETLVLNAPIFKRKIVIDDYEKIVESEHTARLQIKKVHLGIK